LKKEEIVRLDSVSTRKVGGFEQAIEAHGARPVFRLTNSLRPQSNRAAFRKTQVNIAQVMARTVEELWIVFL
jgi:hypothetical protein